MDETSVQVNEHLHVLQRILLEQHRADADLIRRLAALHALDRSGKEYVREEVALALSWSFDYTRDRMHDAVTLVERYPATVEAMANGRFGWLHARALLDLTRRLDPTIAAKVEERVLRSDHATLTGWRTAIRRSVSRLDPRGDAERHDDARADRTITLRTQDAGMASLYEYLPAEDAQAVWAAVQGVADSAPADDPRSADQKRADALVALCCGCPTAAPNDGDKQPRRQQGRKPSVEVVVALSTLLGIDEQPGELTGYGPIPADVARRIAADPTGTWRRLVTDDTGRLIDHGTARYRPPADLRDFVIARDRTCRMPGCTRPARRCDLDHRRARSVGGTTCAHNLQCLCPRHHALKHEAGWTAARADDGSTTWTTPTGRTHITPRTELPADRTVCSDDAGELTSPRDG